jgi:hypothetical protein
MWTVVDTNRIVFVAGPGSTRRQRAGHIRARSWPRPIARTPGASTDESSDAGDAIRILEQMVRRGGKEAAQQRGLAGSARAREDERREGARGPFELRTEQTGGEGTSMNFLTVHGLFHVD